jgi:hypothetical protein
VLFSGLATQVWNPGFTLKIWFWQRWRSVVEWEFSEGREIVLSYSGSGSPGLNDTASHARRPISSCSRCGLALWTRTVFICVCQNITSPPNGPDVLRVAVLQGVYLDSHCCLWNSENTRLTGLVIQRSYEFRKRDVWRLRLFWVWGQRINCLSDINDICYESSAQNISEQLQVLCKSARCQLFFSPLFPHLPSDWEEIP